VRGSGISGRRRWGSTVLESLVGRLAFGEVQGNLLGDADAVTLEGYDFFGVVGQDADVLKAEIDQDLGAYAAFVLHHTLAGGFAIELAAGVKMNLRQGAGRFRGVNREAAAGVMEIEKNSAAFAGNFFEGFRH